MIIVRLKSGLGNQLFQYAFGRALSEKTKQLLFFDKSYFGKINKDTARSYELGKFVAKINCPISSLLKYRYLKNSFLRKIMNIVSSFRPILFFKETSFDYDVQISHTYGSGVNYYDGYWQSPLYFNAIRPMLLEELKIKQPLSSLTTALSKSIQKENAISIHVRRGDYVQNKKINAIHGLCSLEYYHQAIKWLVEKEKHISFYIFSDDIAWTKVNLKIEGQLVHYVEHISDANNHEDLYLMSICKHHIIANSSFSWWGAWLNDYPLKRVIAPKKWFADELINTDDLIPAEWIRI